MEIYVNFENVSSWSRTIRKPTSTAEKMTSSTVIHNFRISIQTSSWLRMGLNSGAQICVLTVKLVIWILRTCPYRTCAWRTIVVAIDYMIVRTLTLKYRTNSFQSLWSCCLNIRYLVNSWWFGAFLLCWFRQSIKINSYSAGRSYRGNLTEARTKNDNIWLNKVWTAAINGDLHTYMYMYKRPWIINVCKQMVHNIYAWTECRARNYPISKPSNKLTNTRSSWRTVICDWAGAHCV